MSSRTASSRRAPAKRRKSSRSSSSQGMTTWLVMLGLVGGGIVLYDNKAAVWKEVAPLVSGQKTAPTRAEVKSEPRRDRDKSNSARAASNSTRAPVPPAAVGVVKAAVPVSRPANSTDNTGPMIGQNFSGKFYFCGTSGLDNCVMSGDTFWYKKTKVVLADIVAPRTDGAACQQERDRGFAAKVRLKELLGSGRFDLETLKAAGPGTASDTMRVATRDGRSLGSILVSEGLAKPRMARQQGWCP